uniref:Transposase n=1 Tax=Globodera rostochiensis TaxID=31243 RepID=A0A914I9G2_GLORO
MLNNIDGLDDLSDNEFLDGMITSDQQQPGQADQSGATSTNHDQIEAMLDLQNSNKENQKQSSAFENCQEISTRKQQKYRVHLETIKSFKRSAGMCEPKKCFTECQKVEIIEQFEKWKKKCRAKFVLCSNLELEAKIAKELGVHSRTINRWKSELYLSRRNNIYSDREKLTLIRNFDKIKKKFPLKSKSPCSQKIDEEICKKLCVSRAHISRWKKEFGLARKRGHTATEKLAIVEQYREIKRLNPQQSNVDIADDLGISETSLRNWRKKFDQNQNQI